MGYTQRLKQGLILVVNLNKKIFFSTKFFQIEKHKLSLLLFCLSISIKSSAACIGLRLEKYLEVVGIKLNSGSRGLLDVKTTFSNGH